MASWDRATIKDMLGIPQGDNTHDAAIDAVMTYTLSSIEGVLQRGIELVREIIKYPRVLHPRVFLPRFPILLIHEVNGNDVSTGLPRGWLLDPARGWVDVTPDYVGDELELDYEGGFDPIPDDLLRAMLEAFNAAWAASDDVTGLPDPNASTGVIAGSGEVQSVTLADFGTVRWDVAAQSVGATALAGQQANYGWLAPWASVLDLYRSEYGTDLGLA